MDYSQQINDFLEGGLDKAQEQELFSALSSSEALRNEMKQSISIDRAFDQRLSSFAPSAQSTVKVFSQLGFAAPAFMAAANAGMWSKMTAFWGKSSAAVLSGLAGVALTSMIFLFAVIPNINNDINNSNNKTKFAKVDNNAVISVAADKEFLSSEGISADNSTLNEVPVVSSYSHEDATVGSADIINNPINKKTITTQQSPASLVPAETLADDNQIGNSKNDISANTELLALQSSEQRQTRFYYNSPEQHMPAVLPRPEQFSTYSPGTGTTDYGISVELQGGQYWTSNNADMVYTTNPQFHNTGIAVLWHFSDDWSLLTDFRQEKFYQEFEGTDDTGDKFLYRQNPNYLTLSSGLRYRFFEYGMFSSFGQALVGFTQTGYAARTMLGIEYKPYPGISMIVGAEGSGLSFEHQQKMYFSPKFGLLYGISFNF